MPLSKIFISHASADKALADLLVQFLKEAIGVPGADIFCSSVSGHGIPLAVDFNEFMKQQIQNPELVVVLMTEQYLESAFCLMELGAAWSMTHKTLAIVVPPVSFDNVTKTLGLKQAWRIEDRDRQIDLRQLIRESNIELEKRTDHDWEKKRHHWNADLKTVLGSLSGATKVSVADHDKLKADLAAKANEMATLEDLYSEAREQIAALEKVKDAVGIAAVKKEFSDESLEEKFKQLLEAVREARPYVANYVFRYIALDYFNARPHINWNVDDIKSEFREAVERKFLTDDPASPAPIWSSKKLAKLKAALGDLKAFLDSVEGQEYSEQVDSSTPMEPDDVEFWERHLSLW